MESCADVVCATISIATRGRVSTNKLAELCTRAKSELTNKFALHFDDMWRLGLEIVSGKKNQFLHYFTRSDI
jgi:hypothetical protein